MLKDARLSNASYNGENLLFLIPSYKFDVIVVEEGTGDNLLKEDRADGYVDYFNWTGYTINTDDEPPVFEEADGGMILLTKYAQEMDIGEIASAVLDECTQNNVCPIFLIKTY